MSIYQVDRFFKLGFIVSGSYNVFGILFFSCFFTNTSMEKYDPAVFSWFGQLSILLWGLSFWAVANTYHRVGLLIGVFVIEKLVYGLIWVRWMLVEGHRLPEIANESLLTAVFFSIYGAGDLLSCIFFLATLMKIRSLGNKSDLA